MDRTNGRKARDAKQKMTLLDSFFLYPALAAIGMAFATAPLGCFVVWRRMAYFGDATAHAAILGVSLSLALELPVIMGIVLVALIMAFILSMLSQKGYAVDTVLGVLAHSALAFGLISAAFLDHVRIDLMAFLLGDILTVNKADIMVIWTGAVLVSLLIYGRLSALLTATLNPELASARGINPQREQLVLTISLALVVALAIKIVGVLLIAAMLVIPAASARPFSSTPEQMVIGTILASNFAALGGLYLSFNLDLPTGPTMVGLAALLFAGSAISARLSQYLRG